MLAYVVCMANITMEQNVNKLLILIVKRVNLIQQPNVLNVRIILIYLQLKMVIINAVKMGIISKVVLVFKKLILMEIK